MASMPHDKGFESIASVDFGYQGGKALEERISFVTSGGDKTVCLWNLSRENRDDIFEEVIHPLEIKHTNRIHSLCMVKNTGILYTGGADFRLNAFDMKAERAVGELNLRHMIHDIQKNNTNPNYLLVTLAKSDGQFVIFDQRCSHPKGVSLLFGAHETDRMERYAKPDWHNNGYTVMCGSPAETRLNFWDIRYTNVEKGPSFTISLEAGSGKGHRVLQSVFLPNKGTTASVTSSRSLIWMDYRISPDCKPSTVL
ncbi:WD40-repeat-containing domain protein [Chlamydoabsidia padenii]|nr:WD40-repeat-containing domain protein [Chlamydoabsidia padenii]